MKRTGTEAGATEDTASGSNIICGAFFFVAPASVPVLFPTPQGSINRFLNCCAAIADFPRPVDFEIVAGFVVKLTASAENPGPRRIAPCALQLAAIW
jgi:hypothetical protein